MEPTLLVQKVIAQTMHSIFSATMLPVLPLLQGVEILGEPRPKLDEQGEQKTTSDLLQWTVSVIVPRGRLSTEQRITLLAPSRPALRDGQIVAFPDLHIGAYSGTSRAGLYLWATEAQEVA